jgi:hypothetical protein
MGGNSTLQTTLPKESQIVKDTEIKDYSKAVENLKPINPGMLIKKK